VYVIYYFDHYTVICEDRKLGKKLKTYLFGSMLERYRHNMIYTPSDLFEIYWDITEDHSQIANIYIGFGRDITSIGSPDLMPYVKVHDPTKYIQRHPGLIGEERV
jgi:hypothetical protein